MNSLYSSIKQKSRHVLPANHDMSCGSMPTARLWDYNIVVHYRNHKDRKFVQTSFTVKCTVLHDELSYAQALGALPELDPRGTINFKN